MQNRDFKSDGKIKLIRSFASFKKNSIWALIEYKITYFNL